VEPVVAQHLTRGHGNRLPLSRGRLRNSLEVAPVLAGEPQASDQPFDGPAMRDVGAPFEMLNAPHAQAGPLGQRLLGQAGRDPILAQQRTERDWFLGIRHRQPQVPGSFAGPHGTTPPLGRAT
jgi:hypothetical protein